MLMEYIEEALKKAHYELIDDEEPYYGEVKELKGYGLLVEHLKSVEIV